jgi:hypothetical protein
MMARNPYAAPGFRRGLRPVYPGYPYAPGRPSNPNRPGGFRGDHYRGPYISSYWPNYWGVYPYIWPGYPLDYDDYDNDYGSDQGPVADYGDNGYYGDQGYANPGYGDQGYGPEQQPPPAWPSMGPYAPHPEASPQPAAPPSSEDAVTLIFKDGRPPQQIHNYVLTPTILYAGDIAHRQVIPISEIDVPATEKANADAGVDFHLPQLQVRTVPNPGLPDTHVINPQ